MGASTLLALIIAAAGSPVAGGESAPFSLTLQGAASLGTYEAAVNWTLIRLIRFERLEEDAQRGRFPHLEALSGSSAGSVNALLAAALWCEADDEVENLSVDRNLLRDVWLPIGLDQLLPGDPALYTPSDGLFASSAFTPVVDSVQARVFSGKGLRFKPGCRVPVGFTMTRVVPQLRTISGLRVKSQQTVVPLLFEVDRAGVPRLRRDTGLRSTSLAADTAALADAVDASGPYVPPDEGIQALLASAAFPVAFGARPVCECRRACGDGQREVTPEQCPGPAPGKPLSGLTCSAYSAARGGQEFKLCRSNFIDGGFLDNAPVGLAIEQAEAFAPPRTLRPLTVLLIDPTIRRPRDEPPPAPERAVQGFSDAVVMGNDLVTTAREQRLAEAIVSRHWNLTTRLLLFRTGSALAAYASIVSQLEAGQALAGAEPVAPAVEASGPGAGTRGPAHRSLSAKSSTRRRRAGGLRGHCPGEGWNMAWPQGGPRRCPRTRCFASPRTSSPSSRVWRPRDGGPVCPCDRRWPQPRWYSSPTSWSPMPGRSVRRARSSGCALHVYAPRPRSRRSPFVPTRSHAPPHRRAPGAGRRWGPCRHRRACRTGAGQARGRAEHSALLRRAALFAPGSSQRSVRDEPPGCRRGRLPVASHFSANCGRASPG